MPRPAIRPKDLALVEVSIESHFYLEARMRDIEIDTYTAPAVVATFDERDVLTEAETGSIVIGVG